MKKEYIKPIIINIKIYNDDALLNKASLFDIGKDKSFEHIADDEDDGPIINGGIIWND